MIISDFEQKLRELMQKYNICTVQATDFEKRYAEWELARSAISKADMCGWLRDYPAPIYRGHGFEVTYHKEDWYDSRC